MDCLDQATYLITLIGAESDCGFGRPILTDSHETEGAPQYAHHRVAKVWIQELIRTTPGNHHDPILSARADCVLRYARHSACQARLRTHHAVHPDMIYAQISALLDDLRSDAGIGENEDRIRPLGNGPQVRIARIPFELRYPGIDGGYCITRLFELSVAQVAARFAPVRYADHGDLPLREKILHQ